MRCAWALEVAALTAFPGHLSWGRRHNRAIGHMFAGANAAATNGHCVAVAPLLVAPAPPLAAYAVVLRSHKTAQDAHQPIPTTTPLVLGELCVGTRALRAKEDGTLENGGRRGWSCRYPKPSLTSIRGFGLRG
mmetsp:Transcript_1570/g.3031  ORF Transcript_1570/g.3031 Transcript_1570/m.3031 type:complete len:133 (+) Transcript_1570:113-511(+)